MTDTPAAGSGTPKWLQGKELPYSEFMSKALYDPEEGYYMSRVSPTGFNADFITSPLLSPVFSFALARLVDEFVRQGGDEASQIVDIGCGDGTLIHSLCEAAPTAQPGPSSAQPSRARADVTARASLVSTAPNRGRGSPVSSLQ